MPSPSALRTPTLRGALIASVLCSAVGCAACPGGAPEPTIAPPPAAPEPPAEVPAPAGLTGLLHSTGTWSSGSWSWTAQVLACVAEDGTVLGPQACDARLPAGTPIRTFQGKRGLLGATTQLQCPTGDRTWRGRELFLDEDTAAVAVPGHFSFVGDTPPTTWTPRDVTAVPVETQSAVVAALSTGTGWIAPRPSAEGLVTRAAYSGNLDGSDGDEAIVEAYLNPTTTRPNLEAGLYFARGNAVVPIELPAAPDDAVMEVAGRMTLPDGSSLMLVLSKRMEGGLGKHVVHVHDGVAEVVGDRWCDAPPVSKGGRTETRRQKATDAASP